jgi:hypothetical protein
VYGSTFYLGYFKDLVNFKRDLFPGSHFGSRYPRILPGYVIHSLFSPVTANFIVHLTVHSIAVLSLFSVLRITAGVRAAFLTAMVFSLHPWLWAATRWDYVDGPDIAYCLLAMALLTRSARQPVRRGSLLLAGMALAGMLYTNLSWITIAPLLLLYYIALVRAAPHTNDPVAAGGMSLVGCGIRNRNSGLLRRQLTAGWQSLVLALHNRARAQCRGELALACEHM